MRKTARSLVLSTALFALLCVLLGSAPSAYAQRIEGRTYIVGDGETLSSISARLHSSVAAVASSNHLTEPYALRTGRRLRIPSAVPDEMLRSLGAVGIVAAPRVTTTRVSTAVAASVAQRPVTVRTTTTTRATGRPGGGRWGRPASQGFVRLVRESSGEQTSLHMRRVTNSVLSRMRYFLRFADGRSHSMDARLLRQLAVVSDHFGGRRIHVISGFRPFRRGQWTPHSNHNVGKAVDFRVEGVSNRTLRDYCRSFPATGCGFYPRSVFVHMDVRSESATWVDWSRPGQRPQYGREDRPPEARTAATTPAASAGEDEGVDDVAQDSTRVREATGPDPDDHDETPAATTTTTTTTVAPTTTTPAP